MMAMGGKRNESSKMKIAKVTSAAGGESSLPKKSASGSKDRRMEPSPLTQNTRTEAYAKCSSGKTGRAKRKARSNSKHRKPDPRDTDPSSYPDSDSSNAAVGKQSQATVVMGKAVIDPVSLRKAIGALCRHVQKVHQKRLEQNEATDLLADSRGPTVCLMFSLQKIPKRPSLIPRPIELPHPLLDASCEVCAIVREPQRKWKDLFASCSSLRQITRVISFKKLPRKFPQFADRRALCAAYDAFIVDKSVKERAYNSLGKVFYQTNKLPLPVRMGANTLEREVGRALRSTSFVIRRGPAVAVRVGKAFAPAEEIYENAVAVLREIGSFFQSDPKWKNVITTVHVQATSTPALPVYMHPKYADAAQQYSESSGESVSDLGRSKKCLEQEKAQNAAKTPNMFTKERAVTRGVDPKQEGKKRKSGNSSAATDGGLKGNVPNKRKKAK